MSLVIPAPMVATEGARPFTDATWIYEPHYGGYRCLAHAAGGEPTRLRSKNGADCTAWFPELAQLLAGLPGGAHVIDGEVCILDESGRRDPDRLQERVRARRRHAGSPAVTYCAFDLLFLDGQEVMSLPLLARKALLRKLLQSLALQLVIVGDLPARTASFYQAVAEFRVEGVIAKRLGSKYLPGVRSRDWVRIGHESP